ncbi:MAG: ABC transporter permease subunit [Candidatus Dormibacteria bacterium]
MRAEVSRLDFRLRRRSLLSYTIGMAFYALIIVVLYPQFKDSTSLDQLTKNGSMVAALFGATGSLTSPSGWLDANIYENFLPLIMLLITVGYGAACIAGQDEDGTLSLAAILPVSRRAVLLQKVAMLVIQAMLIALVTMVCIAIGRDFDLSISIANLTGVTLGVALLGIDFGLLALAVGSWTGSRGTALGLTATVAAASYLVSSLAPVVAWIRPAKYFSLFYWSVGDQQLAQGLGTSSVVVLLAVGAVLTAVSVGAFRRLDLH